MLFVVFIITVLFTGIGFSLTHVPVSFLHPFSTYVATLFSAFRQNIFLTFLGMAILLGFFFIRQKKSLPSSVKLLVSMGYSVSFVCLSIFLSFILLYGIALLHLNIFSLLLSYQKNVLGVLIDRNTIVTQLTKSTESPQVVITGPSNYERLTTLSQTTSGTDNFYGKYVLTTIPSVIVVPLSAKTSSIMYLDNTLIFSGVSAEDIYSLSPTLGFIFVKKYFWNRKIAAYPHVMLMDEQEYTVHRQKDAYEKIKKIDTTLFMLDTTISSLSATISAGADTITSDKDAIANGLSQKDVDYKSCLLIKKNSAVCRASVATADATLQLLTNDITTTTKTIEISKQQQEIYKAYRQIFAEQKKNLQTMNANIPHELGVFEPKNAIKIVFDTKHPLPLVNYLEILTHEYLHYASFISDQDRLSNPFFEEALTEYFARNIIQKEVGSTTTLGYPVQVAIMQELMKKIPESDWTDIYFSKDDQVLADVLNRVYGEDFYQTNSVLFESLQYSSNSLQTLSIANQIMKKIGGRSLTQEDLKSIPAR